MVSQFCLASAAAVVDVCEDLAQMNSCMYPEPRKLEFVEWYFMLDVFEQCHGQ